MFLWGLWIPRTDMEVYRTHRSFWYGYGSLTELTGVPGTGMDVLQNTHKFRVGI